MRQVDYETAKRCKELIARIEAKLYRTPAPGVRLDLGETNSVLDTLQRVVDIAEGAGS